MHSIPPPLLPWSTRAPIAMIVELGQPPEVLSPPLGPSSEHGLAFLPSGKALLVVAALTVYCRRLSSTLLGKKDLVSPCTRHPGHEYPSRGGRTGIGSSSPVWALVWSTLDPRLCRHVSMSENSFIAVKRGARVREKRGEKARWHRAGQSLHPLAKPERATRTRHARPGTLSSRQCPPPSFIRLSPRWLEQQHSI